ncbi:MAG: chromosome segregation protein SMC [Candidatus Aminicenantes bacterium]|nr:MAG: chromosome segregation protein SMC [Candidatus Aminicenantes bacterium]
MIIKKLELQGFKSFPEKTKIMFHPGITVIVGPNGTGKSNIVDALMWVLGGKRLKSFRGERGTEMIFNGSQQNAPMSMADVTLSLEDKADQLKINHRYFRSGESEYRLNGKLVRLKDIQEAMWKKSIGEKEYFVIEQGAIGSFLSSKPMEKRHLLEEAAGTAYYKDKKRQAQNKLENSEQNLTRLEDIIAEVSKAKNSLKRQANAAIRYRKLRENIRHLTAFNFRKRIHELEQQQEETLSGYNKSLNRENQISLKLKEEEANLAAMRKDVWDQEKTIKESRENLFGTRTQIAKAESEKDKESRRSDFFADKKKGAESGRGELAQELESIKQAQSDATKQIEKFQENLDQIRKNLKKAENKNQSVQMDLDAGQKKIEILRNEHLQHLSEYTEIKNERAKTEKEYELVNRQQEKLQFQLGTEKDLLAQKKKVFQQKGDEFAKTQTLFNLQSEELDKMRSESEEYQASIQQIQDKIAGLSSKREKTLHQLHALEKMEETERASAIPSDIEGALGILADLIDAEESQAPLIDLFWKEETKASLLDAESFLRTLSDKGLKGSFLLLHPHERKTAVPKVQDDPRVIGLLKSHIQPSQTIKDKLSHLEDAIITKDIKSAVELWLDHPSLNYVTASADVLFSSGFLKAGDRKEGLVTLRREKAKLQNAIDQLEKEIHPLTIQLEEKTGQKAKMDEKIQSHSSQIGETTKKIEEAEKVRLVEQAEVEKMETNISLIEKELAILAEDKAQIQKNLDSLKINTQLIEDKEEERKKTILTQETALISLQEAWEKGRRGFFELKSNADLLTEKINNLNAQMSTLEQRKQAIQAKTESLGSEIKKSEQEKQQIKKNIRYFTEEIKKLNKELKDKEDKLIQDETRFKQMQKEQKVQEERVENTREESEARKEERVKWEIKKAERERDLVNLEESCWQEIKKTLREVKKDMPIEDIPDEDIEGSLTKAQEQLQSFKAVNLMAEEEYEIHKKRHDFMIKEREDLQESIASTREAIKKIDQESKTQFLKAITEVNKNFKEIFGLLFQGGHAEVKLTDPHQVLESGVEIVAQPPGKRVQNLNLLSGGERALTSLAFFFALFQYKPTPFCMLDEVDAALDEVNLGRFLNLMKKVKEKTQFILVTHNFKTMEVADYIYGTTMAEPNITSIYSMKIEDKDAP